MVDPFFLGWVQPPEYRACCSHAIGYCLQIS
jgi:hypothetical protein